MGELDRKFSVPQLVTEEEILKAALDRASSNWSLAGQIPDSPCVQDLFIGGEVSF